MEEVFERFRKNLEIYNKMGLNPLSLATGCAVKVDLIDTVYPALEKIKNKLENIEILPREDADIFITREKMEIKRIIGGGNFDADRGVSLIQVNQDTAGNPEKFANFLLKAYSSIRSRRKLTIGKGHSIVTTIPSAEVAVIDLIKLDGNKINSYTLANNDTIQIVDPLEDPGSQMQVDVAISNSLNDLFTKGAYQNLRMLPLFDAPNGDLKERIMKNYENYSEKYNIPIINDVQPNTKSLMLGATVLGESDHELPTYYNKVEEGDEIIVTRPIGELAPINVYLWILVVPEVLELMESRGISFNRLEKVKMEVIEQMRKPNIPTAKVIYNYLPEFGKEFDRENYITMTTDVTGPGIFVIKEFAEKAGIDVKLDKIPVIDEEIAEFATEGFIIPNSTSGTNGATVIFCSKKISDNIMEDLQKEGLKPIKIGKVLGKGKGVVHANKDIERFIHRKNVLSHFKID